MNQIKVINLQSQTFSVDIGTNQNCFEIITIKDVKNKLSETNGWTHNFDNVSLSFNDIELNDYRTLHFYDIKKDSTLTCIKYYNPYKIFEIQFTDKPDAILNDNSSKLRALLSCGHAVDPNSLTNYCRSIINDGKFEFKCPAIDERNMKCNKIWDYSEIRKIALLDDIEREFFERKIAELALARIVDFKECPKCKSFLEREDLNNLRVVCKICNIKGTNFEFCWQCENEWTVKIVKSADSCGRKNCLNKNLTILSNCKLIKLSSCSDLPDIPSIRACPTCGMLVEHDSTACKNIICLRCKVEFCFVCLLKTVDCQKAKPGSYFHMCANSLAPIQTKIPVWNKS